MGCQVAKIQPSRQLSSPALGGAFPRRGNDLFSSKKSNPGQQICHEGQEGFSRKKEGVDNSNCQKIPNQNLFCSRENKRRPSLDSFRISQKSKGFLERDHSNPNKVNHSSPTMKSDKKSSKKTIPLASNMEFFQGESNGKAHPSKPLNCSHNSLNCLTHSSTARPVFRLNMFSAAENQSLNPPESAENAENRIPLRMQVAEELNPEPLSSRLPSHVPSFDGGFSFAKRPASTSFCGLTHKRSTSDSTALYKENSAANSDRKRNKSRISIFSKTLNGQSSFRRSNTVRENCARIECHAGKPLQTKKKSIFTDSSGQTQPYQAKLQEANLVQESKRKIIHQKTLFEKQTTEWTAQEDKLFLPRKHSAQLSGFSALQAKAKFNNLLRLPINESDESKHIPSETSSIAPGEESKSRPACFKTPNLQVFKRKPIREKKPSYFSIPTSRILEPQSESEKESPFSKRSPDSSVPQEKEKAPAEPFGPGKDSQADHDVDEAVIAMRFQLSRSTSRLSRLSRLKPGALSINHMRESYKRSRTERDLEKSSPELKTPSSLHEQRAFESPTTSIKVASKQNLAEVMASEGHLIERFHCEPVSKSITISTVSFDRS